MIQTAQFFFYNISLQIYATYVKLKYFSPFQSSLMPQGYYEKVISAFSNENCECKTTCNHNIEISTRILREQQWDLEIEEGLVARL